MKKPIEQFISEQIEACENPNLLSVLASKLAQDYLESIDDLDDRELTEEEMIGFWDAIQLDHEASDNEKVLALFKDEREDQLWKAEDYLVCTDSEADEECRNAIADSLWAFNPDFLAGETGIDSEVFEAIQGNGRCESNNDAIASIIKATCGFDSFADSAMGADGRGHFLSSYDGEEHEQEFNGQIFYIYKR